MKTAQKIKIIPLLLLLWSLPVSMLPHAVAKPHTTALPTPNESQLKLNATENYGKLPLSFEANQGQSADEVQFLSRGKGYTLFLTPNEDKWLGLYAPDIYTGLGGNGIIN